LPTNPSYAVESSYSYKKIPEPQARNPLYSNQTADQEYERMMANQSRNEHVREKYAEQEPNSQYLINPRSAVNTLSYYRPAKTHPAIAYNQNSLPTFQEFEASYDDENLYNDRGYEQDKYKSPEVEFDINNPYPSNAEYSNGQKLYSR